MNRTLTNVLFGGISAPAGQAEQKIEGTITKTTVDDTVESLLNSENVILVCSVPRSVLCVDADTVRRSLAMAWLLRRRNMPFRTS